MYKIGWFSSGRGSGSRALLTTIHQAIQSGNVKAEIAFVFCNREPGFDQETDKFLDLVRSYRIPLACYSSKKYRDGRDLSLMSSWRIDYDREVMKHLDRYPVDLCVLAGYMLIVGPEMCRHYTLLNLHPAAPGGPKGTWKEVIWELIGSRAESSGVMMHLATPDLDEGPPVTYCTYSLRGKPFNAQWERLDREGLEALKTREGENFELFKLIRQHGLKREFPLIVTTVKAFSEGRVAVRNGQIVDSSDNPIPGYDLTEEIDKIVA